MPRYLFDIRIIFFPFMVVMSMLGACGNQPSIKVKADAMAEQYFELLESEKYAEAALLFTGNQQPSAKDTIEKIKNTLGILKKVKLTNREINTVLRGKFFIYQFETEYEKYSSLKADYTRHHATEILTIFYDLSDESLAIVAHTIESGGLHQG